MEKEEEKEKEEEIMEVDILFNLCIYLSLCETSNYILKYKHVSLVKI